jgi:hypothetical protein
MFRNFPKWMLTDNLVPVWNYYYKDNSFLLNGYSASISFSMIGGIFGTKELLFPILIVGQKTPSPNPCNCWRITPANNPSTIALKKGGEI